MRVRVVAAMLFLSCNILILPPFDSATIDTPGPKAGVDRGLHTTDDVRECDADLVLPLDSLRLREARAEFTEGVPYDAPTRAVC
jgi:hypothetical protein